VNNTSPTHNRNGPDTPRYHLRIADAPTDRASRPEGPPGEPLSTLRGAGAGLRVDTRRVGRVIVGILMVALAVLVVGLFLSGAHKNAQITKLHQDGVPVTITVSGCEGLLGGSGSNAAGYTCRGSFTLDGRRDNEAIPGDTLHPPGTRLRGVSVPGDPALVTTAGALAGEQSSGKVFILPAVLLAVLVLAAGTLVIRRRSRRGP
jgi:hypothetical protein